MAAKVTFIKKARKDYPNEGIKRGDSYYSWGFRFGGVHRSKTQPRRSQLTQSEFSSTLYELEDGMEVRFATGMNIEDVESELDAFKSEIEELKDETEGKLDNMPDGLKDGDTGQLLQERIDGLDSWISDLDSIDLDVDEELTEEEKVERIEEIIGEILATSSNL